MSKVIVAAPPHAAPGPPPAPAGPLRLVRRIGYAVLGLQLACFLAWSTILFNRFSLTADFSLYNQALYLIAHGSFDPYSTVLRHGHAVWRNNSEFALWPLAALSWIWPHGPLLLWLQDLCIVAAEAVAFTWLCELAQRHRTAGIAPWLAGTGLVLLVADPWIWWAVSFDVHTEALVLPFAALLAWDFAHGRRRMWAVAAVLLAWGAVAATYLAGIGLAGMLTTRRSRVAGAVMVCLAVGYSLVIVLIHGDDGLPVTSAYGYLAIGIGGAATAKLTVFALAKGILTHPLGVLRTLWAKRVDLLANLAPAGLLGIGFPLLFPLVLVVLLADTLLPGLLFTEPLFQALPIYVLLPVGTVAVLAWFARRRPRAALLLAGLVVAQTLGWEAVWLPRTPGQWLRVSSPAAATLASVAARIPASAEVAVSQGVSGRFSGRADVRPLAGPETLAVSGGTWFVIAPLAGIEMQSTASAMALIGELAGPLHATLVTHADGVWAFRWHPPEGVHTITVPDGSSPLPAWAAVGAAGRAVLTGPAAGWHVLSAGGKGYVADGLAWQEPPGQYQASVTLSATGPVNVEVWNDTSDTLLARQSIPATTGAELTTMPVDARAPYPSGVYSGWGPFRAEFQPPPVGDRLEIRVWSPGGETVNVYRAEMVRAH